MAQLPSKQLCPLCGLDDEVKVVGIRDGKWLFICSRTTKHVAPYEWTSSDVAPSEDDAEPGVMETWGSSTTFLTVSRRGSRSSSTES